MKTRIVKISLFFSVTMILLSQLPFAKIDPGLMSQLKARSIGPANMSGRIASIDAVDNDPDIIYIGTGTGGVWKSENGGITWKAIFDKQTCSSIGAVAIFQKNPNIVWIGTGEPLPRNSCGVGRGVFKSLNGGKTWLNLGLPKTEKISAICLDPDDPDIAYVAAMGTTWGENQQRGIFKTADGGKTWQKILYVDERTGAADLAMDPENPNKLFAAMWEHRRWPWFFNSGGPGSGLFITVDAGRNWNRLTDKHGLPKGDLGRIGVAFAPGRTNVVYALVEAKKSVLLRSEDGGASFKTVNREKGISGRPFYYSRIWVNPKNENMVYMLQTQFRYSTDGGRTFANRTTWGQSHVDFHAMWIHPAGEIMIVGNDGGIVISNDRGENWRFVQNLPLAQFYHISFDNEIPYNVYGGLQDNGSWRGPAYSIVERGLFNYRWQSVGGGDGFDTEPDPENSKCGYGMSQGGNLYYFNVATGLSQSIKPTESEIKHRYHWNAGFAIDPFESATIYLGSQFVHRSRDKGMSWEIISPDLTTNDPKKQKQAQSGGLTFDVTNAENHTTILCISPSPVKKGVIWVGTDDGNIQLTTNGGKNWSLVSTSINKGKKKKFQVPAGTYVTFVEASHFDPATAFVVFDDHRRSNWTSYVYVTRNYGKSWQSLVTEKIDGFAHVIRQDPLKKELLYLGTEFGLFISLNGGGEWFKWTHGLPTVPVRDLGIHTREHDLIIGTHGRSAYIIDDITPLREISEEISRKKLHLFKVGDTFQFRTGRLSSYSNPGDAAFNGTNKQLGLVINYFLIPEKKKKQENDNQDSETAARREMVQRRMAMMRRYGMGSGGPGGKTDVKIEILDSSGKTIRKIDGTENKGVNRIYWDFRHDPPDVGQARDQSSGSRRFRGGLTALPGKYIVKIKYHQSESQQQFELKNDPRLKINIEVLKQNFDFAKKVQDLSTLLTKAQNRLNETKKLLSTIREYIMKKRSPKNRNIKMSIRDLEKKIQGLSDRITPDTSRLQGITDRSAGLSSKIRRLGYSAGRSHLPLTQGAKTSFEKENKKVKDFLSEFHGFFAKEVREFQDLVKKSGFSLFPDYKELTVSD